MSFFSPSKSNSNNSIRKAFEDPNVRSVTISATKNYKDGSKDKYTEVHYKKGSVMKWDSHKDK